MMNETNEQRLMSAAVGIDSRRASRVHVSNFGESA
jgi:hypothetical protein